VISERRRRKREEKYVKTPLEISSHMDDREHMGRMG
jgi:hypothetical protein